MFFKNIFLNIGMAKTSTSAHEAIDLGYLEPNNDTIVMNRNHQISIAKKHAILMSDYGYLPPCKENIKVLGTSFGKCLWLVVIL